MPTANCACSSARRVCVEVNPISADGTGGVAVPVLVCLHSLVPNRPRRPAVAIAISAPVLTADPTCRIAVLISIGIDGATVLSPGRIASACELLHTLSGKRPLFARLFCACRTRSVLTGLFAK